MKRVSWGILLCAALMLFASPVLATSQTVSTFDALKSAVTGASDGDVITVAGNITLTSTISIDKAITLQGTDKDTSILDANEACRVLYVATNGGTVKVENVTIRNGKLALAKAAGYGGAGICAVNTNLLLNHVKFEDNNTANAQNTGDEKDSGGGLLIVCDNNKTYSANITNCDFIGNKATVYGAGVYTWPAGNSTLNINVDNCNFEKNAAMFGGGLAIQTNFKQSQSDTTAAKLVNASSIKNSVFKNNTATTGTYPDAGALLLYSGNGPLSADVSNCTFEGNKSGRRGGAIGNWSYEDLTVSITNCLFKDNETEGKNGTDPQQKGGGGAIANYVFGNTTYMSQVAKLSQIIEGCTFINNKSKTNMGGAIFNGNLQNGNHNQANTLTQAILNSTFIQNSAGTYGGAVANLAEWKTGATNKHTTTQVITNCTFVGNGATYGPGGVYNEAMNGNTSETIITNCIFGDAWYSLYNGDYASMTVKNCSFTGTETGTLDSSNKLNVVPVNLPSLKTTKAKVNGVEHVIMKLTSDDIALVRGGATGMNIPKNDQLGAVRSTSAPSIGAIEYMSFAISTAQKLPDATVGKLYNQKLEAKFEPAQVSADVKWSLKTGSTMPWGLALSGDVISGEPVLAGDYTFALVVEGSGDAYAIYSADATFSLKVNDGSSGGSSALDAGTITVKSSGGTSNLNIELTSADYGAAAATSSADLTVIKSGTLSVTSADAANVIITIDPGKAEISAVLCDSDDVTSSLEKSGSAYAFTPSKAGTYKIIFSAADGNATKYFATGFTYTIDDDSGDDGVNVSDSDVIGQAGSYRIKPGIKVKSKFTGKTGRTLLSLISSFLNASTTVTPLSLSSSEAAALLQQLKYTADDIGDAEDGYKIIGAKLSSTIPAKTPFIVAMRRGSTPYVGIGATQAESDILIIKFDLLKELDNTSNALSFPQGTYTVGAIDSSEYLNTASVSSSELNSASVFFMTADGEGTIGSVSFGDVALAGTESGDDDDDDDDDDDSSSSGGSGGCDTGLSGAALLALAVLAVAGKAKR